MDQALSPEFLTSLKAVSAGIWFLSLIIYIFWAYCLHRMARKTDTPYGWFAYIPILNFYLMCKVAGKPGWWVILLLLPVIQIIFAIIICVGIAKALKRPGWMGVLATILPLIGLVFWACLAFGKEGKPTSSESASKNQEPGSV